MDMNFTLKDEPLGKKYSVSQYEPAGKQIQSQYVGLQLFIVTLTGKTVCLQTDSNASVEDVKAKIATISDQAQPKFAAGPKVFCSSAFGLAYKGK